MDIQWMKKGGQARKITKGFTLVELLVVIFIIGILSAIIFPRLNGMREKARDTQRITDIRQIEGALERYFNREAEYPGSLGALETENLMPSVPRDPKDDSLYVYQKDDACSSTSGTPLYSLSFKAENPETFVADTTLTPTGGDYFCTDAVRVEN